MSLEPLTDPPPPSTRRPTRVRQTGPDMDPVVHARKPILTVGNGILAVVMITFGLYASGNLPQLDRAFDGLHSNLQSRSGAVVSSTMHYGPLLLLGFVFLIVVVLKLLRFMVRPPVVSDAMEWHSAAAAAPRAMRPVAKPAGRAPSSSDSILRPLHKQSAIRNSVVAPSAMEHAGHSRDASTKRSV